MILDRLSHAEQYAGLHAGMDRVLQALAAYTPENYPSGRLELDGKDLFLIFTNYETHPREEAVMEAHQKYLDVMYMVEGEETIYVKPTEALQQITAPYDPAVEALLAAVDDDVTAVRLTAGQFVILYPQDAHAPACHGAGPGSVKKIIGKVRIA